MWRVAEYAVADRLAGLALPDRLVGPGTADDAASALHPGTPRP
jgi:hypothetical protein